MSNKDITTIIKRRPLYIKDYNVKVDSIFILERPYKDDPEDLVRLVQDAPLINVISSRIEYPKVGDYIEVYHPEVDYCIPHLITHVLDNSDGRYDIPDYEKSKLIICVDPNITNENLELVDKETLFKYW